MHIGFKMNTNSQKMEALRRKYRIKSETIRRVFFNKDGSENYSYISSISYYGLSGYLTETLQFYKNGNIKKHIVRDEIEIDELLDINKSNYNSFSLDFDNSNNQFLPNGSIIDKKAGLIQDVDEYDQYGRISSTLKVDPKGNIRLEEYSYDENNRIIKTKIIHSNGNEEITKDYWDKESGFLLGWNYELNGELVEYTVTSAGGPKNPFTSVIANFEKDKIFTNKNVSDESNLKEEDYYFENEIMVKKKIIHFLVMHYFPIRKSFYGLVESELKLIEEDIYDYDFYL